MDRERYARVKEVFRRALDRREEDQQRFLDEECGADQEVRQEVESLLRYHVSAPQGGVLDDEAPEGARPEPGEQE
jgi:hypothetical protein